MLRNKIPVISREPTKNLWTDDWRLLFLRNCHSCLCLGWGMETNYFAHICCVTVSHLSTLLSWKRFGFVTLYSSLLTLHWLIYSNQSMDAYQCAYQTPRQTLSVQHQSKPIQSVTLKRLALSVITHGEFLMTSGHWKSKPMTSFLWPVVLHYFMSHESTEFPSNCSDARTSSVQKFRITSI